MTALTATILTRNEEENLPKCLESVRWADEIQVIDSGSTDRTLEIARSFGAEVVSREMDSFTNQRRFQFRTPRTEWLFWIDADERCTPELAAEIQRLLRNGPDRDGYTAPRITFFHGRPIYHCGWFPDRMPRLFHKGEIAFSHEGAHSKILIPGRVGELQGLIEHRQNHELGRYVRKMLAYAEESARAKHRAGKRCGLGAAIAIGPLRFLKTYLLQRGFLDGKPGLEISFLAAMSDTFKYLALYRLSRESKAS